LKIKIVGAKILRDTEFFTKMDPFVVIEYHVRKFKTTIKNEGGQRPVWNESFTLENVEMEREMKFICLEDDLTTTNSLGETKVKVSHIAKLHEP
jgi:Ca2+-dependent lipid-binding protein